MPTRQTPWPSRWLMTDERIGDLLWPALDRLPRGGGVVFRHHSLAGPQRRELAEQVAERCRARGLTLAIATDGELAVRVGANLVHNPNGGHAGLPVSRSAHDIAEAEAARAAGACLLFVSPVHATASHPGRRPLGLAAALDIAQAGGVPAIALGGMDEERGRVAMEAGFHGWAAIDAWTRA